MTNIALFDLDHTLLPLDSDYQWGLFTAGLGWHDALEFQRQNDINYQQYQAGVLDIHAHVRFAARSISEQGADKANAAHLEFMRRVIEPAILPAAKALVQKHRAAGDEVLIVTATNEFVTRPIAAAFGVHDLIAVNLVRDPVSGWFGNAIDGVPSFRAGKVRRVHDWLQARGLDWADVHSSFYSDSINDLPLLEQVTQPVATNPDPSLRALAMARGWPILDLFGPQTARAPSTTP